MNIDISEISSSITPVRCTTKSVINPVFKIDSVNNDLFKIINTIDNGSCLIDALLLSTSHYYRSLSIDDRQPKCNEFRTNEFIKYVPESEKPLVSNWREFLYDIHLQFFASHYKINIIIFNDLSVVINSRQIGILPRINIVYANHNDKNGFPYIFMYNHGQELNNNWEWVGRPKPATIKDLGIDWYMVQGNHYSCITYKDKFAIDFLLGTRLYQVLYTEYDKRNISTIPGIRDLISRELAKAITYEKGDWVNYLKDPKKDQEDAYEITNVNTSKNTVDIEGSRYGRKYSNISFADIKKVGT